MYSEFKRLERIRDQYTCGEREGIIVRRRAGNDDGTEYRILEAGKSRW